MYWFSVEQREKEREIMSIYLIPHVNCSNKCMTGLRYIQATKTAASHVLLDETLCGAN